MNHFDGKHVLLTGATGFLGHYLLAAILRRTKAHCTLLLRPAVEHGVERLCHLVGELGIDLRPAIRAGRVIPVEAELPETIDEEALCGVDVILHAAASTKFRSDSRGDPVRTNVEGTRRLLETADRLGVRRFALVSTAYACGRARGNIAERAHVQPASFNNDYEASKWKAEKLVAQWAQGSRIATIFRPSILFGDAKSGRTTSVGGIYVLARAMDVLSRAVHDDPAMDRNQVRLRIPGRADASVNLVPVCWAADKIIDVLTWDEFANSIFHLVNPYPPTCAELKDWLERFHNLSGGAFTDAVWPWPNPTRFEDALLTVGESILDYFQCDMSFASKLNDANPPRRRLVDEALFCRSLSYLRATNWGRERVSSESRSTQPFDVDWYFKTFMASRLPHSQVAHIEALTTTVRFDIESDVLEGWVCRFEQGLLTDVDPASDQDAADFGYRVKQSSFYDIVTGRKSPQQVFFEGAADLTGDQLKALQMVPIIQSFIREFPVRSDDVAFAHARN